MNILTPYAFAAASSGDPYLAAVLLDTPYLYYRFDDVTGTVVSDTSGNGRAGVGPSMSTITTTGLLSTNSNKAIVFTSSTVSNQILNTTANVVTTNDFSAEVIIKPSAKTPSGVGTIVKVGAAQFCPGFDVTDIGSGLFRIRVMSASAAVLFNSTASFAYGTRLVIVMTYDATTHLISLYINGTLDSSGTHTYVSSTGLTVGYNSLNGIDQFYGVLDEFAVYQTKLSAIRVLAHYSVS